MEFHHPLASKRPLPGLGSEIAALPLQSFIPLVETGYPPPSLQLQTLPEQTPVSSGLASGFQAYDNTQFAHSWAKRRKLDGNTSMSPANLSYPHDRGYGDKSANDDSFAEHVGGQPPALACWSDPAMPPSLSLGPPLAKQMTNLGLLLCPCPGFCWGQPDGYCPLPEASPTVYDPNQPYAAEKQPSMQMPSEPRRLDGLPILETEQYSAARCGQGIQALSSLGNYPEQDHSQMASPSGSAKDVFFPQNQSTLVPYSDEYAAHDSQASNPVALPSDYMPNDGQLHVNQVQDFADAVAPPANPVPLSSMSECGQVAQLGMLAAGAGGVACQPPTEDWSEPAAQRQPPCFDILLPDQRGGKRGPFKDPKLREQTAQTRRVGSCMRCRSQRIRCESDPEQPRGECLTCLNLDHTKVRRFPCLRCKITDIKLYKPGQVPGYEWTRRWTNSITDPIQRWASPEVKVIHVSAGLSKRHNITLRVREFIPQEGDKLERTWDYKGTRKSVAIPPYALIDLEATKATYSAHIEEIMTDTIYTVLDSPDGFLCKTYLWALRLRLRPSTPPASALLLDLCLKLWVSIRLSTTSGFLVGDETLGMSGNILDETSPDAGKIPMPPVLGAQLDLVLIHHLQPKLRREMLEGLQKFILRNKQATWFVTYLVMFILLHNVALLTAHDARYARKHGMKRHFAREDKVKEYHAGANNLLAHFHYSNKNTYPFSEECKDKDLRNLADLNEDETGFIHATRDYVKQHRHEWEKLWERGECEDDFFFVSQMFDEKWGERPTI